MQPSRSSHPKAARVEGEKQDSEVQSEEEEEEAAMERRVGSREMHMRSY